jgi:hypothetical protein
VEIRPHSAIADVYVNGERVPKGDAARLTHGDRVAIARASGCAIFRYHDPAAANEKRGWPADWASAQEELRIAGLSLLMSSAPAPPRRFRDGSELIEARSTGGKSKRGGEKHNDSDSAERLRRWRAAIGAEALRLLCGVDEANALARSIGARARFAARWARPDASVAWNSSSVLLEVILVLTEDRDEDGESRDADASVSGVAAAGAPHVGAFTPTEFYDRLVVLRDARDAYARNGGVEFKGVRWS